MPDATHLRERALRLLHAWFSVAEADWWDAPRPGLGCYGSGYNAWGVQTNQKYLAAMAALAAYGQDIGLHEGQLHQIRDRALAALRFSLASHHSGDGTCADGSRWGHTWISGLGIERMMHGVALLRPHMTDTDRTDLRRMLLSEAEWQLQEHKRGRHVGVVADRWNASGMNNPESNLWNGALLWRVASMYPDAPATEAYRHRAHEFLVNSVSVPADEHDATVLEGRSVRDWFVGANFFPHYALDHHGYLNVGYMAICISNAAMLHFDLRAAGMAAPASLYHHQADLWRVLRRMIFPDARLARIGGDSRLRYTYCQEYLLPSLLLAADQFNDRHALDLADRQLALIEHEAAHNGDGSFYGKRLSGLRDVSPFYFTRLESDRANVLGMLAAYLPHVEQPSQSDAGKTATTGDFEASVAGLWCEPEHGAVLHRSRTRLASFAWRAHGYAQGLCLPPDRSDLAEWSSNMAGVVRFMGDPYPDASFGGGQNPHRSLLHHHIETFDGGFVTCGSIMEGVRLTVPEGLTLTDMATHHLALAALPDGHTVVALEWCQVNDKRAFVLEAKGLHLNVPNDLYNGFSRTITTGAAERAFISPPEADAVERLSSTWANVDGVVGVVGIGGSDTLVFDRKGQPRGGKLQSLYVDEVCWHHQRGARPVEAGATIFDVSWAVLSSADVQATQRFTAHARTLPVEPTHSRVRRVEVTGLDGQRYRVTANFGDQPFGDLPPGQARVER